MRLSQTKILEQLQQPQQEQMAQRPQTIIHKLDKESWRVITIFTINAIIIFGLTALSFYLNEKNKQLSDNDLKYRYIKMHGYVNEKEILQLEQLFGSEEHKHGVKKLRKQVEDYEETIHQKAIADDRLRLQQQEAEYLNKEIKELQSK